MTSKRGLAFLLLAFSGLLATGDCRARKGSERPTIEITRVPPADKGGPDVAEAIEGRVHGMRSGQHVVVYARSRAWWLQPGPEQPFAPIERGSTWTTSTHLGTEYAALLVEPDYRPPAILDTLPELGAAVVARVVVAGDPSKQVVRHTLRWGGYEWTIRGTPSDRGGQNLYDPSNAWTDDRGALHLRLAGSPGNWTCAQIILSRTLGYGTYSFVVGDVSALDPAAVLAFYTLDGVSSARDDNPREWNLAISRWGDPTRRNAQYVIQPSYAHRNTYLFDVPPGALTHTVRWEPGRLTFRTLRGSTAGSPLVAEHVFTEAVPVPGEGRFRINLYDFQRGPKQVATGGEFVIVKFEFLP